ncbi:Gp19/Gp15/Gp42 family protein [Glutamicibacter arilaitensis]|uniref:Gp19/Gp15/Gp42 family protein n=1 Tax=Glutamicibacter arilaitensis TaxID=256701 RepID=UPI003FD68328
MATPFATLEDLRLHWSELPAEREADAEQKLAEASIILRALYSGIDAKIAIGQVDSDVVKLIVCRMVKRSLLAAINDVEGVATRNETAGGVSMGISFSNPNGNLYLTKDDKNLLGGGRRGKAFMIVPGFP